MLLAAIVGIVSEDAAAAPVLGILIAALFTWVFTRFRPFKEHDNNVLGEILSYSLLLFFVAALMIKAEMTSEDSGDQETFGILLIFILIAGPLILTLITVMQLLRAATSVASHSCCGSKEEAPADQQEPEAGSKNPAREADSSVDRPPADL